MKAYGYIRVSTEEQGRKGTSPEAQLDAISRHAAAAQLNVAKVYADLGISGGVPLQSRPEGGNLVNALDSDSVVIAYKLDRLFRNAIDCMSTVTRWTKNGISLYLTDLGGQPIDTKSAMGRFFLTVMAALAEMERGLTRERTLQVMAHRKALGKRVGQIPYGFRLSEEDNKQLVPADDEQQVIEVIKEMRAYGLSQRQIATWLNATDISPRGARWHQTTIYRILRRVRNG